MAAASRATSAGARACAAGRAAPPEALALAAHHDLDGGRFLGARALRGRGVRGARAVHERTECVQDPEGGRAARIAELAQQREGRAGAVEPGQQVLVRVALAEPRRAKARHEGREAQRVGPERHQHLVRLPARGDGLVHQGEQIEGQGGRRAHGLLGLEAKLAVAPGDAFGQAAAQLLGEREQQGARRDEAEARERLELGAAARADGLLGARARLALEGARRREDLAEPFGGQARADAHRRAAAPLEALHQRAATQREQAAERIAVQTDQQARQRCLEERPHALRFGRPAADLIRPRTRVVSMRQASRATPPRPLS